MGDPLALVVGNDPGLEEGPNDWNGVDDYMKLFYNLHSSN